MHKSNAMDTGPTHELCIHGNLQSNLNIIALQPNLAHVLVGVPKGSMDKCSCPPCQKASVLAAHHSAATHGGCALCHGIMT